MPRARTLPRHGSMIVLHNEQTYKKLNIPQDADEESLIKLNEILSKMLEAVSQTFYVETGQWLIIRPDEADGFRWCVEDNVFNSSQYPWLKRKCLRIESKIVERMNESGIKTALGSPNHN